MPSISQDKNDYHFTTEVRVRLSETDAVGIVYFGNYATYMDVGRMDYLNQLGLPHYGGPVRDLIPGAVVSAAQDFYNPARYNDILLIHVRCAKVGKTSYTFHYLITDKRRPRVLATGAVTLVWLDANFLPTPIPDDFRAAVQAFEGIG